MGVPSDTGLGLGYKFVVSIAEPIDPAPDWSLATTPELCCPLCEYNLRGLEVPRCPECGFAFAWSELIRGQREKHPYLFEHHPERNVWSFFKTYWNDCRPRRFWRTLNAAHPVRIGRLLGFWVIASVVLLIPYLVLLGARWGIFGNSGPVTVISSLANQNGRTFPPGLILNGVNVRSPTSTSFFSWVLSVTTNDLGAASLTGSVLLALAWPWMTLGFLMIFSQSMRRAKVKKRHVLRSVIYSTDFGLLALAILLIGQDQLIRDMMLVLAVVTQYRLTFAYSRYLRFHLPFLTVLTSQIMVMLLVVAVLLQFELMR